MSSLMRRKGRLRDAVTGISVGLLLAIGLGVALLTRFPESRLLERAGDWPVVGPAARAFRDAYVQPQEAPAESAATAEADSVVVVGEAKPWVWVDQGAMLRSEPRPDAPVVATLEALRNVPLIERHGAWAWVDLDGALGWVIPRDSDSGPPVQGSLPDPVLPMAARPPEPTVLETGVESFSGPPVTHPFGQYQLLTDWPDGGLVERCRELEAGLEVAYQETFGLVPIGQAEEVILLFARQLDYESFWRRTTGHDIASVGHADRGVVATYVSRRSADAVCATLIHELTHLLNRRAVGPALPPWLEEGMATEIAARHGGAPLQPQLVRLAAFRRTVPSLESFLAFDRQTFRRADRRQVHYQLSGLWMRFLLEDGDLRRGLLSFLAYLRDGGPYNPDLPDEKMPAERPTPTLTDDLSAFLDSDLDVLDERFRAWIEAL